MRASRNSGTDDRPSENCVLKQTAAGSSTTSDRARIRSKLFKAAARCRGVLAIHPDHRCCQTHSWPSKLLRSNIVSGRGSDRSSLTISAHQRLGIVREIHYNSRVYQSLFRCQSLVLKMQQLSPTSGHDESTSGTRLTSLEVQRKLKYTNRIASYTQQ